MEYSVIDLIRILLKKWYVILITIAAFSMVSSITARKSYEAAVLNYETYTTEQESASIGLGTLHAVYQYQYELLDFSKFAEEIEEKLNFYSSMQSALPAEVSVQYDASSFVEQSYAKMKQTAAALPMDTKVLNAAQKVLAGSNITNALTAELLENGDLRLTISGLTEEAAERVLTAYLDALISYGASDYSLQIELRLQSEEFVLTPVLTKEAQFAQQIMEKPTAAPIFAKTVGTSAVAAFALACFGILLVTFIRDTRRAVSKERTGETS